jgi:hypothetical protein
MTGWDQYITNLTSQGITHAGIFGADGSKWAVSPSFPVRYPTKKKTTYFEHVVFNLDNRQN